jgi:hypothetical protein
VSAAQWLALAGTFGAAIMLAANLFVLFGGGK